MLRRKYLIYVVGKGCQEGNEVRSLEHYSQSRLKWVQPLFWGTVTNTVVSQRNKPRLFAGGRGQVDWNFAEGPLYATVATSVVSNLAGKTKFNKQQVAQVRQDHQKP